MRTCFLRRLFSWCVTDCLDFHFLPASTPSSIEGLFFSLGEVFNSFSIHLCKGFLVGLISSGIFVSELLMDLVYVSNDVTSEAYLSLMIRNFQSASRLRMKVAEIVIVSKTMKTLEMRDRRVGIVLRVPPVFGGSQ